MSIWKARTPTEVSMTSALAARGLVKRFGNHVAVDEVSFVVPRGVVFGILGPNGAGKSTILRMLNDIFAPDAGEIVILDAMPPGIAASRNIGYLPEERGLYPRMKVVEMISFMGELRGLSAREAKRRSQSWIERLGLGQWAKNRVEDLSKGMQQKVQFATALIHEPDLVVLDEPWSGLDPINAEVLRATVDEIRAMGRTIILSTHNMEQAEKIVDHVCIIARGKKVLDGDLREIKRQETGEGRISIGVDEAERATCEKLLADGSLAAETRPKPHIGFGADFDVRLANGVTSHRLLAALVEAGIGIRRFEVLVPTLHQIFLEHVGDASVAERREVA
jgi:ABC-2 type transport system ATP-binding protein